MKTGIRKAIADVKKARKKLQRKFDGDSNDAEHDAAVELCEELESLFAALEDEKPSERKRNQKIRALAKEQYEREGELELDEGAVVSEGDDNGAYVQMWRWVEFSGTDLCKGENGNHEDCGDECPFFRKLADIPEG